MQFCIRQLAAQSVKSRNSTFRVFQGAKTIDDRSYFDWSGHSLALGSSTARNIDRIWNNLYFCVREHSMGMGHIGRYGGDEARSPEHAALHVETPEPV
jgi:hypothetical protein